MANSVIFDPLMDWIIIIAGACLLFVGFIGCIFPVIPGPPIAYGALLLLLLHSSASESLGNNVLVWLAIGTAIVTVLDFALPVWGTRRSGGTRAGRVGSTIGLLTGLFLGPIMIVVGPFIGAFVGEIVGGQTNNRALRSAFGSFLGFLSGSFLKIVITGLIAYYFIRALL